jgi:hypothetical protein
MRGPCRRLHITDGHQKRGCPRAAAATSLRPGLARRLRSLKGGRPGRGGREENSVMTNTVGCTPGLGELQSRFLEALPRLERHARAHHRGIRCPARREDAVAETVAVAWKWFLGAAARGKDVTAFAAALAGYAARHVRSGRGLCGQEASTDALSPLAQARRGFLTRPLPQFDTGLGNPVLDALADNTVTPPPEQAAFRLDFPAWLETLGERKRRAALDLATGVTTRELAGRHGVSQGRVSQLRRELHGSWERFCQ